jgi:hypothetical protein
LDWLEDEPPPGGRTTAGPSDPTAITTPDDEALAVPLGLDPPGLEPPTGPGGEPKDAGALNPSEEGSPPPPPPPPKINPGENPAPSPRFGPTTPTVWGSSPESEPVVPISVL